MTVPRTQTPLWGRLEVRVIAALALLGILCVGASAYLVQLSVGFFDQRMQGALTEAEEVASAVRPFYRDFLDARRDAYDARARALALEISLEIAQDREPTTDRLEQALTVTEDLVRLEIVLADARRIQVSAGDDRLPDLQIEHPLSLGAGANGSASLLAGFALDPKYDARYQAIGRRQKAISLAQTRRPELEEAVIRAISIASALVLLLSFVAGFALARTTTRKVSELSRAMGAVGGGDLSARVPERGNDELAQLGRTFNRMLDELRTASQKVAYLERVGAWQGMARRLAHEIKNPLTPIALATAQLREKDPKISPEFSKLLNTSVEIVEEEVKTLRRMVDAFSRFAKVPEVKRETISLRRVIEEFERAYGHLTERDTDRLDITLPPADLLIEGDRQLLKQALVNLVENAVLSAREANVESVVVELAAVRDGSFAVVTVDDNGPGIAAERREAVFEPYETGREHGTGLGLAIVKKVVLDHGGEVSVTASERGGARFILRLPAN